MACSRSASSETVKTGCSTNLWPEAPKTYWLAPAEAIAATRSRMPSQLTFVTRYIVFGCHRCSSRTFADSVDARTCR